MDFSYQNNKNYQTKMNTPKTLLKLTLEKTISDINQDITVVPEELYIEIKLRRVIEERNIRIKNLIGELDYVYKLMEDRMKNQYDKFPFF